MSDALGAPVRGQSSRLPLITVYLRCVALVLLAVGLIRAGQILGITLDGKDFSDMAPAWRAAATTLVLVDLFAAVGLWAGAVWGPVMWAVALVVEVSMYTLFASLFGSHPLRVAGHGAMFAVFLALAFLDWWRSASD